MGDYVLKRSVQKVTDIALMVSKKVVGGGSSGEEASCAGLTKNTYHGCRGHLAATEICMPPLYDKEAASLLPSQGKQY